MIKYTKFIISLLFLLMTVTVCNAEDGLNLKWKHNDWDPSFYTYFVQSKFSDPITITGYTLNRGNMISNEEKAKAPFKPTTIRFGDTIKLFNAPVGKVIEIIVHTNKGDITYELN